MSLLPSVVSGNSYTATLSFLDAAGNAFTGAQVASASYLVLDMNENTLVTGSLSPANGDAGVTVVVPGVNNTLGAPVADPDYPSKSDKKLEDAREIRVSVTLRSGAVAVLRAFYRVTASDAQLVVMQNSFQTYAQALLTANGLPDLKGFPMATDDVRTTALLEGYRKLIRFGYYVRWPRDPDAQNYIDWAYNKQAVIIPRLWVAMTTDRWFSFYPEDFRAAMRRAQVYEADAMLYVDPYVDRRASGIVMEKVGPTSVEFLPQKSAASSIGLAPRTLEVLRGMIDLRLTTTRS